MKSDVGAAEETIMGSQITNKILILFYILLVLIIAFFLFLPTNQSDMYFYNYVVDGILGIACITVYGYYAIKKGYELFSPITILTLIYVVLFFFTPIYDIVLHEYCWFGVDLFAYGIKGSVIAFIGYVAFLMAYNIRINPNTMRLLSEKNENAVPFILMMYGVCFLANVYYLVGVSGNSLAYIFSLGLLGGGNSIETTEANLGFISMLSFSLPSCTLLYVEYGKNKPLKIVLFALMFILQVERGFRFYIIQIALMYIAYYFFRYDKKPKVRNLLVLGLLIMVPIVLMTMFRNTIRSGLGMDLSVLSVDSILKALDAAIWDNFRIYKTYYGIIKAVPRMTGYMFGQQMLVYTIIMFVPRIIWPAKPSPPGGDAIALGISNYSVLAGTAYPNIGEYYYEFGVIGVVFFMALFGWWMKKIYVKYKEYKRSNIELMVYCTLLGAILQLTIRGYTPSNFWMIVFALLPYLAVQIISSSRSGNKEINIW